VCPFLLFLPLFKKVVQNFFYFFAQLFPKVAFGSTFPKGGILAPPFPKVD